MDFCIGLVGCIISSNHLHRVFHNQRLSNGSEKFHIKLPNHPFEGVTGFVWGNTGISISENFLRQSHFYRVYNDVFFFFLKSGDFVLKFHARNYLFVKWPPMTYDPWRSEDVFIRRGSGVGVNDNLPTKNYIESISKKKNCYVSLILNLPNHPNFPNKMKFMKILKDDTPTHPQVSTSLPMIHMKATVESFRLVVVA